MLHALKHFNHAGERFATLATDHGYAIVYPNGRPIVEYATYMEDQAIRFFKAWHDGV